MDSIKDKLNIFLGEFFKIIPQNYLMIFDEKELEMLINGLNFIDVDDWERNTEYKGSYYKKH